MELLRNRLSLQSGILIFFSSQASGVVVDLLRLAKGDFTCLVAMGYFSTVLDTLGVLFSYCLMVWGWKDFQKLSVVV